MYNQISTAEKPHQIPQLYLHKIYQIKLFLTTTMNILNDCNSRLLISRFQLYFSQSVFHMTVGVIFLKHKSHRVITLLRFPSGLPLHMDKIESFTKVYKSSCNIAFSLLSNLFLIQYSCFPSLMLSKHSGFLVASSNKYTPASGPLHILSSLPVAFFPQIHALFSHFFKIYFKY